MVMAAHLLYFFTTRPHHYCYELSLSFFLGLFWERFLESCEQAELSKKNVVLWKKLGVLNSTASYSLPVNVG